MKNAKRGMQNLMVSFCVVLIALCAAACSIPVLESSECLAARDVVKQYYSLAVGGDLASHPDELAKINALRAPTFTAGPIVMPSDRDPFTFSLIAPISSRIGDCSLSPDGRAHVEATVIWRHEAGTVERMDLVSLLRSNDAWLIERIDIGKQPGPQY
jgi:hypothetical protein